MDDLYRASLGNVLDNLGTTLLETVIGNVDPTREIASVIIYDPDDPPFVGDGDIVLGVGIKDIQHTVALVAELVASNAAALVLREPLQLDAEVVQAVRDSRIVVLGLTRGASWSQVARAINVSLGAPVTHVDPLALMPTPPDLFSLANSIATLLDAPITIEDLDSNIVAFSANQTGADQIRREGVIGRRVPAGILALHKQSKIFREIYSSERPVFVDRLTLPEGMSSRVAMGVRAGNEVLGSIWAVTEERLNDEREQALMELAEPVAMSLLFARLAETGKFRALSTTVATLIAGGVPARRAAASFRSLSGRFCVIAAGIRHRDDNSGFRADLNRLGNAFALHMSVMHPKSVTAIIGNTVYCVAALAPKQTVSTTLQGSAREFLRRVGPGEGLVVGLGAVVDDATQLARSRDDAERALSILRAGPRLASDPKVATFDDVQSEWLMQQLDEVVALENRSIAGPIAELISYDVENQSDLAATLRVWLDSFGDIAAAASTLHIHPNTLRYRVRRIAEVAELDLASSEIRFRLAVQMRVFGIGGPAAPAWDGSM
ncbi:MAG: PucR family transcriptional regulator [Marmoricola sp.]|nr:PucR family transcriptional regulator [Marmoricola sp.]